MSPIAFYLKGLDPSLKFCCQGPTLICIKKVDKMSPRISLTLEASEMFLYLHMIFSLARATVVRAVLKITSMFDPSLEMIAPSYL